MARRTRRKTVKKVKRKTHTRTRRKTGKTGKRTKRKTHTHKRTKRKTRKRTRKRTKRKTRKRTRKQTRKKGGSNGRSHLVKSPRRKGIGTEFLGPAACRKLKACEQIPESCEAMSSHEINKWFLNRYKNHDDPCEVRKVRIL